MKTKSLFMPLVAICLSILWGCTMVPQKSAMKQAMKFYEEFLASNRNAKLMYEGNLVDADFSSLKWIRYAHFDMNGDGIPELHIVANGIYRILSCRDGELVVWAAPGIDAKPLENGAVLGTRDEGYCIRYWYEEYDFSGNVQLRIDFGIAGPNDKGEYDENSAYYFEDEQVSKEQWDTLTEPYFSIGSDKIEWIDVEPRD